MLIQTLQGDCREVLKGLPDNSVNCCVTSPPYFGLRDYGAAGQIGLEETPSEYVAAIVEVFKEVRRVLTADGTVWLNIGDSYDDNKQLQGIPWRVAFALQDLGFLLRSEIIWHKPNAMPESVTDRPTKSHEQIFLLTKSSKYYYDYVAIKEPAARPGETQTFGGEKGRNFDVPPTDPNYRGGHQTWGREFTNGETKNKRSVWTVATTPFSGSHFATFPEKLIEPCILAGCPAGGTVLDPFGGSGTTGRVAARFERNAILIELNPEYHKLIDERTDKVQVKMAI